MESVPPEEDRAWIHEHLRVLVKERGASTFLGARLFEPSASHFPDRFTGDVPSAKKIFRRLLTAASMANTPFEVESDADDPMSEVEGLHHVREAAAWFSGIDDGVLQFGISSETMQDGDSVVGVLCHEVAHAYRAKHDLVFFDAAEDELQTDLTTVFLGFGLLTTDLTDHYRRRRDGTERVRTGYLSAGAMSYALAVQLAAREVPRAEVKRLARLLGPGQEAFLLDGHALAHGDRAKILGTLGAASPTRVRSRPNEGQPVFRLAGGWFRKPRCGGRNCDAVLSKDAVVCPTCGGVVSGEARNRDAALAAVEQEELALGADIIDATSLSTLGRAKRRK